MGSYSILVIGDWREELEPFLDAGHIGNPFSPHIKCTDILNDALRKDFRLSQKNVKQRDRVSFSIWLKQRGLNTLAADEKPDLAGTHRSGWIQLNKRGEITEVIMRNLGALILYVSGEIEQFLLKPGAVGWDVNPYEPEDLEITQGYASSAQLCDIDFATMRQSHITAAPANWERASRIAAGRTWVPFKEIRKKYPGSYNPYYPGSDSLSEYQRAAQEWTGQQVVQQLREDEYLAHIDASLIDAMMLPRNDYVEHCVQHAPVLKYFDVLHQHRFLIAPDESDLLAGLDGNTKLTSVVVKH